MRRHMTLGFFIVLLVAAPAAAADVLWQAPATRECKIVLVFADGPVEVVRGAPPRLLGDARRVSVAVTQRAGETLLTLTPAGSPGDAGVLLEAPVSCRLDVQTQTGDITLIADKDDHLGVELATSGEITVDFSITIDYHHHEEPAKRGLITTGPKDTGETPVIRLSSRQGAIRVLRSRPRGAFEPSTPSEIEP